MPCVTSGKEGSLSFNSAMMLEQKDEGGWFLVLVVEGCGCAVTKLDGWDVFIYLGVSVSMVTPT